MGVSFKKTSHIQPVNFYTNIIDVKKRTRVNTHTHVKVTKTNQ